MRKPIVVNAAIVGALVAVTASAWGMKVALSNSTWIPAPNAAASASGPDTGTRVMPLEAAAIPHEATTIPVPRAGDAEALPSNEHVPAASEMREPPGVAPATRAAEPHATQPPITVEERHLTIDERIQAEVIDKLAQAPNLSGKIGVESHDAVVTLSGWTTTSGQAHRAGRYARSVEGVKYVQNEIRPRVGGSI